MAKDVTPMRPAAESARPLSNIFLIMQCFKAESLPATFRAPPWPLLPACRHGIAALQNARTAMKLFSSVHALTFSRAG
jgi:hypothetical protein